MIQNSQVSVVAYEATFCSPLRLCIVIVSLYLFRIMEKNLRTPFSHFSFHYNKYGVKTHNQTARFFVF